MDDQDPVNLRCSVLFFRDNSVLLCHRAEEDAWVLPGGTPRRGEGSAACARREVAEETGIQVAAERVVFVLETTSWDVGHHLIEIVFTGAERDPSAEPTQLEGGLAPSFVPLDDLNQIRLRPPIAGYIRGFARSQGNKIGPYQSTGAYLGNVWRPTEGTDSQTSYPDHDQEDTEIPAGH